MSQTQGRPSQDLLAIIAAVTLVAGLGFMGTSPFIADYVVMAGGLIGLAWAVRMRSDILVHRSALMVCAALALLALTLPFVYRSEMDLLPLLACAPLLLAPGLAALLLRDGAWLKPHAVPLLCLFGAVSAGLLGLWEVMNTGTERVGVGNNPIHYAGITTIVGFLALTGLVSNRDPWRWIYLLGPAFALVGVVLSASRGPLLAWAALAALAFVVVVVTLRQKRVALAGLAIVAIGAAIFMVTAGDSLVMTRITGGLQAIGAAGTAGGDAVPTLLGAVSGQDATRAAMYDTGIAAFQSSPLFGIGFGQMMPLARDLYPQFGELQTLENLHSDLADFAALGGAMGLAAFALMLFSPLAALRTARRKPALLLGALVLVVGYGVLGLTNAMFGVLPQTVLFGTGLAYLIALDRAPTV
ncbi:O-antigen ligase family protein [Devosia sp. 63-57]|uniref:O-antigen ligase family protein n=1 Tax=Devosia sp. 63-57 TaxID=1895751 RepID=UPI00086BF05F|nr:O-antigen ligase family protein [Devosia sp. 63-57]ODU86375.1 MAG: hypothetical protein ABT14_08915 [Pelagibacterium sp. SCN 63-17]